MKIDFKILDGVRGIAATYVVLNHCRGNMLMGGAEYANIVPLSDWSIWTKMYYLLVQSTSLGREFVVTFFVLSGFSIAHSLRTNPKVLGFYKRRLIRLYPPYILALIYAFFVFTLTASLLNIGGDSVFHSWQSVINNLFYIPTGVMIPQFWSLPHEIIFYLLAPVLLISFNSKKVYYIVSVILYITSLIYSPLALSGTMILTNFVLDYNIYFTIGVYIYSNYEQFYKHKLFSKKSLLISTLILVPLMIVIKYKLGEFNKITPSIAAIYSVFLLICFLKFNIKNRVLAFLGEISYTLYITHFATIYLVSYFLIELNITDQQMSQNKFVWLIGVVCCILIAYPIYFIGEKPSKKILQALRKRS